MTVVASGLDGRLFDNVVPRFLWAGNRLDFDRLGNEFHSHDRLVQLGLAAEIGALPAGYGNVFDFNGEGSNAPLTATITGVGTTTITVVVGGGPVNVPTPVRGLFMLVTSGKHQTEDVMITAGMTAAQAAAAWEAAFEALPDITSVVVGSTITLTCSTVCTYATVFPSGMTPPTSGVA